MALRIWGYDFGAQEDPSHVGQDVGHLFVENGWDVSASEDKLGCIESKGVANKELKIGRAHV